MNQKKELWRNQTLVNRTWSDSMIATEYYTLIKFTVFNYKERMETIQNPLLHLFSHCMELIYKEVCLMGIQCSYIKGDIEKIRKGHDLKKLSIIFKKICIKITKERYCSKKDRNLLKNRVIPNHMKLCKVLATETTTYRYFAKYDKIGKIKGKSVPFTKDEESPNIMELFPLFDDCYSSVSYVLEILYYMFPMEE